MYLAPEQNQLLFQGSLVPLSRKCHLETTGHLGMPITGGPFQWTKRGKYIRFWKGGVHTDLPIQIRDYRVFINFLDFVFLSFTVEKLGS